MFYKRIKHECKQLFKNLDNDFLSYLIEKIDEYKEDFIERNWDNSKKEVPLTEAHKLIDIEMFKMKIRKEIKSRNETHEQ